ncbi:MAG: hypothetical protein ACRDHD_09765 [Candidatus Limnocylindria bacterium]
MDRDELEDRIRSRRPGEAFRRGGSAHDGGDLAPPGGYVPFAPEPEDALALRDAHADVDAPRVDRLAAASPPWPQEPAPGPPAALPQSAAPPTAVSYRGEADVQAPQAAYEQEPEDDDLYSAREDAYAYPYLPAAEARGGGSGALPVVGFVVLCVLALAVGAVLAGLIGGDGVGQATSTPTPSGTVEATVAPSAEPSLAPSAAASAAPEPTDGPVAFADGALLTIQPCATDGYQQSAVGRPNEPACQVDGTSLETGDVWVMVVFRDTRGSDTLRVRLRSNGETLNQQEKVLESILGDCGQTCGGLIYGAKYVDLLPGDYELVLDRNGEFADRALFTVAG